jgi:hypothetical protein
MRTSRVVEVAMRADELVPVFEGPRPRSELIAGVLHARGVHAEIYGGLETAAHPGLGDRSRVMVRAEDASTARTIIEDDA